MQKPSNKPSNNAIQQTIHPTTNHPTMPSNKRGGGVLLALREGIQYNRVNSGSWSDHLEILSIEIESHTPNKCLLCVCYRPPNGDLNEWLSYFTLFLQVAEKYEKVLITGDFNFPELTWNSDLTSQNAPPSSIEFRDLVYDFFLNKLTRIRRG